MRQLSIGNIKLPKLYVVDNVKDVYFCRTHGIPYIVWRGSDKDLIKLILYPTLKKMFPGIKWEQVLDIDTTKKQKIVYTRNHEQVEEQHGSSYGSTDSGVVDVATGERLFNGSYETTVNTMNLDDYIGDLSATVNIEQLQDLHLLPAFLDEITNNIKKNLYDLAWWEGYNKKLGVPLGNFSGGSDAPNLMILDVSGSIPRSIAATMLTLIDTLRNQANADLIITSDHSKFYPRGTEIPSPQELRTRFGLMNEEYDFERILRTKIIGRTYSNVISFGDNDTPSLPLHRMDFSGTTIHHVWHYHTGLHAVDRQDWTGYARWANEIIANKGNIHFNTDWCTIMKKN